MTQPTSVALRPQLRRLWAEATVAVVGVMLAAAWAWCLVPAGALPALRPIAENALLPLASLLVLVIWRAPAGPGRHEGALRAWRRLALGTLAWLASGVIWQLLGRPPVSWADPVQMLHFPLMLAGVFAFPTVASDRAARTRFWLDSGVVVASGAAAAWYFVLGPALERGGHQPVAVLVNATYPVLDLVLLLAACVVLFRRPDAGARRAMRWAAAGLIARFGGDMLYGWQMLHGAYHAGGATDAAWLTSGWLIAVGAVAHRRSASAGRAAAAEPEEWRVSLLPYASVAAVYGFLLVVCSRWLTTRAGGVVLATFAVTALALVRQYLAARDNLRLQRERAERIGEARFRSLVQHSSDVIVVVDEWGVALYASPSVRRVLGFAPEQLVGEPLVDLVHEDDRERAVRALEVAAGREVGVAERLCLRVRGADGGCRDVEIVSNNLLGDPSVAGVVITARDVTERRTLEAELVRQAFHDPLTGLANRALFMDRVAHALNREARNPQGVAVLYLDLDDFKTVNDSLGHGAGDRLLLMVAERLLNATRGCDTVARLGGDEFAVLLENVRGDEDATIVAERVVRSLEARVELSGHDVAVAASVGIARATVGDGVDELLRNADVAMYKAKQRGKGCHELFAPAMRTALLERLELEGDLRRALGGESVDEFLVMYQPIVTLETGAVTGVEALVRWRHPRRGIVAPLDFIPLAESTGLIVPLGEWVLREACAQAAAWQATRESLGIVAPLTITVNISGRQLQSPTLAPFVAATLAETGVQPGALVLEITESVIMDDTATSLAALHALKALGVRLAIDDFGTGYSSLSYLQKFPVDIIKIDKAFVDGVGRGGSDAALTRTIVALGDMLALRCVAEGIEADDQRDHLRALGCEFGQGYLFARPLSAEAAADAVLGRGIAGLVGAPAAAAAPAAA